MRKSTSRRIQAKLDAMAVAVVDAVPRLLMECEPETAARLAVRLAIALKPGPKASSQAEEEADGLAELDHVMAGVRERIGLEHERIDLEQQRIASLKAAGIPIVEPDPYDDPVLSADNQEQAPSPHQGTG